MGGTMIFSMIWTALKVVYARGARKLIQEAVDDPESEWDEMVLAILDRVFDYSKPGKGDK